MTIGELIEKLETFDPEQDVCIMLDGSQGIHGNRYRTLSC